MSQRRQYRFRVQRALDEIIFNEEEHSYSVGGIVRPSVTQILTDLGFADYAFYPEEAKERGKMVHEAIDYIESDDAWDWLAIDAAIKGWVDAYLLMKEQTGWTPRVHEHRVFCPIYNYCGTMDGFGDMPKLGLEDVLPDYKSGEEGPARYQTAGYAAAYRKPLAKRCSIKLQANGKYSIVWYNKPENARDVPGWRAIATTFHLKHGGM